MLWFSVLWFTVSCVPCCSSLCKVHCVVVHYIVVTLLWFTVLLFTISWSPCCGSWCCGSRYRGYPAVVHRVVGQGIVVTLLWFTVLWLPCRGRNVSLVLLYLLWELKVYRVQVSGWCTLLWVCRLTVWWLHHMLGASCGG